MLSAPTTEDLATFTGRAESTFTPFADQALLQATVLFGATTNLAEYPEDPQLRQVAEFAILEMANRLYLEQPFAVSKASPFASETIGSYSYSKGSTFSTQTKGSSRTPTGLYWWDLAVELLTAAGEGEVISGSVGGFEHDLGVNAEGRRGIVGPADNLEADGYAWINAESNPRPRLG